jgi:hypothetical protein
VAMRMTNFCRGHTCCRHISWPPLGSNIIGDQGPLLNSVELGPIRMQAALQIFQCLTFSLPGSRQRVKLILQLQTVLQLPAGPTHTLLSCHVNEWDGWTTLRPALTSMLPPLSSLHMKFQRAVETVYTHGNDQYFAAPQPAFAHSDAVQSLVWALTTIACQLVLVGRQKHDVLSTLNNHPSFTVNSCMTLSQDSCRQISCADLWSYVGSVVVPSPPNQDHLL